jgi:alpha-L-arabinofuranosidase
VTPQYWVLSLYSSYAGDTAIGTDTRAAQYDVHGGQSFAPEITGVPYLDVLGTVNSTSGDVSLFVANRNARNSQPASIYLHGITPPPKATVWTLSAQSLLDKNDEVHEDLVRPVESQAVMHTAVLHHVFPPGSVTVILLSSAR